jgi:Plasmid pRiA4b ORF-3-like protein
MLLYEIRVQLQEIEPPIWRQLRVRPQTSMARLHKILQKAMGWTNSHLHVFKIGDKEYGEGDYNWDFEVHDYSGVKLQDVFTKGRKSFSYEYDLGDSWRHDITLLGTVEGAEGERIACVAGARACPPEDCGGVTGYYNLLEALADPEHEDHEMLLEWVGGKYDLDAFDLARVDRRLKRL